jgi:hypothetical protein
MEGVTPKVANLLGLAAVGLGGLVSSIASTSILPGIARPIFGLVTIAFWTVAILLGAYSTLRSRKAPR